jgi:hypothetical protein
MITNATVRQRRGGLQQISIGEEYGMDELKRFAQ